MLGLCIEGTGKTRIMYKANLSYEQVSRHLKELQERDFIEQVTRDGRTLYVTTERGRDFLSTLEGMIEMLDNTMSKPVNNIYSPA